MGIDVFLEDERGKPIDQILDPKNALAGLFPIGDTTFALLQYVDRYGNAVFNRHQMDGVLGELQRVQRDPMRGDEERAVLEQVIELARRCQAGVHLYLKFYGD